MSAYLLILAFSVSQTPAVPEEPNERMLAGWIADLTSKDQKTQLAARDALVKAGPKAKAHVPQLQAILEGKSETISWSTLYAVDVLGAIGPDAKAADEKLKSLIDPKLNGILLENIIVAVGNISGPTPEMTKLLLHAFTKGRGIVLKDSPYLHAHKKEVARHLIAFCEDPEPSTRSNAIRVLAGTDSGYYAQERVVLAKVVEEICKEVPAVLEKRFADKVPYVRLAAAHGYTKLFPEQAIKVLAMVVETMTDEKNPLGYAQCEVILAPIPEETAMALIPLFDGPDYARNWAVDTLSRMNARAPLETALQTGKTARIRSAAALAMGQRTYKGEFAIPPLQKALADPDFAVRLTAAVSVLSKAERDSDAIGLTIPVLQEGLKHNAGDIRLTTVENLRRVGNRAIPAVPALKSLLTDKNSKVAKEAAFAMVELAPSQAEAGIPALIEIVKEFKNQATGPEAARALGSIGPKAKAAIPILAQHLDGTYPNIQIAAAEAIGRIDPAQSEKMAALLVDVYKEYLTGVGIEAVNGLARIGPPAKAATPALLEAIQKTKSNKYAFHTELILALMAIDPETAKPQAEWLRKNLADEKSEYRWVIVRDLSRHGLAAKPFIRELILSLDSKDQSVQQAAAKALGNLGKDSSVALPKLKELADKATRTAVRKEAAIASKLIEQCVVFSGSSRDGD